METNACLARVSAVEFKDLLILKKVASIVPATLVYAWVYGFHSPVEWVIYEETVPIAVNLKEKCRGKFAVLGLAWRRVLALQM